MNEIEDDNKSKYFSTFSLNTVKFKTMNQKIYSPFDIIKKNLHEVQLDILDLIPLIIKNNNKYVFNLEYLKIFCNIFLNYTI